jgi:hypothetical protein
LGAFTTTSDSTTHSNIGQRLTPDLQRLQQQVLGHTFSNPGLLYQALTHVSHAGGISYQRLELLGDAVLDLIMSTWLMKQLAQALQQQADAAARWVMCLPGTTTTITTTTTTTTTPTTTTKLGQGHA